MASSEDRHFKQIRLEQCLLSKKKFISIRLCIFLSLSQFFFPPFLCIRIPSVFLRFFRPLSLILLLFPFLSLFLSLFLFYPSLSLFSSPFVIPSPRPFALILHFLFLLTFSLFFFLPLCFPLSYLSSFFRVSLPLSFPFTSSLITTMSLFLALFHFSPTQRLSRCFFFLIFFGIRYSL